MFGPCRDEADTHRLLYELQCMALSEATVWKLLLNPKVHAYFTVMFKSQEPNPSDSKTAERQRHPNQEPGVRESSKTLAIAVPTHMERKYVSIYAWSIYEMV